MKPTRESDGAPTPRTKLNGSSRCAIYANRSSKHVSYTHAPTKSFRSTHISYSLIPCRALRRAASVCSLAWSGEDRPGGVVLFVVGMRPKICGGNRAKVMSTDTVLMLTDTTFCVTIYWGCCAGCTLHRAPQNKYCYYGARRWPRTVGHDH